MQPSTSEKDTNLSLEYSQLLIQLGIPQILLQREINRTIPEVKKFSSTLDKTNIRDKLKKLYTIEFTETVCNSKQEIRLLNRFLKEIDLQLIQLKNKERGYEIISNNAESIEDIRAVVNTEDKKKIRDFFIKRYNYKNLVSCKESIDRKAKKSGVYKIRCIPTGDSYIGSSGRINSRLSSHKSDLKSDKRNHVNRKLQALWDEYGEDSFEFSVLEYTTEYTKREKYLIKEQKPSLNTRLLPIEQPLTRIKVLPEIKEQLLSLSKDLEIDMNELVHKLLINELEALTK